MRGHAPVLGFADEARSTQPANAAGARHARDGCGSTAAAIAAMGRSYDGFL
jgi:hypothetical protein